MEKRKGQNSILFLTTLGVYLGLVLVGAPHVLAQAATTRQFDVKDEIELKENLDKKPSNGNDALLETFHVYLADLNKYFHDAREADFQRGSRYNYGNSESIPVVFGACHEIVGANKSFTIESFAAIPLPILLDPHYGDENWSWNGACHPLSVTNKLDLKFAEVEVSRTWHGEFTYEVSIKLSSQMDATKLFNELTDAAKYLELPNLGEREKVLWKNTQLTLSNDTVVIVTRLPRGSLESLLASNAK